MRIIHRVSEWTFDLDELKELRHEHEIVAAEDYWIPSAAQIEELVGKGYISTPAMEKLEAEIKRRGGFPTSTNWTPMRR